MKLAVQKNHLEGQISYRSLDRSEKTASFMFLSIFQRFFRFTQSTEDTSITWKRKILNIQKMELRLWSMKNRKRLSKR